MKNQEPKAPDLILKHICLAYARSTLPERRHLEHTWMWQGVPLTIALTRCTLGFQVLLEALWEWDTLLPKVTPLPQTAHFAIQNTSFDLC